MLDTSSFAVNAGDVPPDDVHFSGTCSDEIAPNTIYKGLDMFICYRHPYDIRL